MKLAIFGATGGTGRCIVEQALAGGHEVTALVRQPRGDLLRPGVTVVQGDVLDPPRVAATLAGQQAVLVALGTSRGSPRDVCSRGTRNIIEAMQQEKVRRVVVETAYGAGESRTGLYSRLLRVVLHGLMVDKDVQERYVRASGLEWVIVRPPRLTNGPRRGTYRADPDVTMGLFSTISRADVAEFMLKAATGDRYLGRAVGIRY